MNRLLSNSTARGLLRRLLSPLRRLVHAISYRRGPMFMSRLRQLWVVFKNPRATIRFEGSAYLGPGFSLHMPEGGELIVGPGVEFRRNFRAEIGPGGSVRIGAGCYLTYDVIIACSTSIEIGERCGVGQCTFIADGSHRFRDLSKTFLEQGYEYRPIKIEDDVQIHSKCTIVSSIGERAIIGANAMITKPIPPYTVAGGVPARVLDYYGPPGMEPEGWTDRNAAPSPAD